jgi:integrase
MNTIKVNFFLDAQRKNSKGQAPIRVRSRHNSDKLIVKATGEFCKKDDWKNKRPIDTDQKNRLNGLLFSIETAYKELSKDRQGITLNDVWAKLNPSGDRPTSPKSNKIVDWIDHYLINSPYSQEYVRGAKHLKVLLTGKSKKGKTKGYNPEWLLSDLNQTSVDSFCTHLAKQGKSTGTIVKAVKFLRQVAKMARDYKIEVGSLEFKAPLNFKKKVKTEVRLSLPELMKIRNIELNDSNESTIRDMFLFLAFTGMRHSDMVKITPANNFGEFLHFTQQKTGDEVAVTLHKFSKPLVKKYSQGKEETEILFPSYSQQTFNKSIKNIARQAGLKDIIRVTKYSGTNEIIEECPKYKLIKTHSGRRSFSRILSLMQVPEEIISEEMGHSGKSITRHYIGNSDHMGRIKTVQKAWAEAEKVLNNTKALMKVA